MASTVTVTVAPSGADYTTLLLAVAGEERNLVTADEVADINIIGAFSESGYVEIDNVAWTVDATRYVQIRTSGAARHKGRWDTSFWYITNSTSEAIRVNAAHTRLIGLQVTNTATGELGALLCRNGNIRVEQCIVTSPNSSAIFINSAVGGGAQYVSNTVSYCSNTGDGGPIGDNGLIVNASGETVYIYFCTCVGDDSGILAHNGTVVAKCTYAEAEGVGADFDTNSGSYGGASQYNASPGDTTAPGANSTENTAATFVAAASQDYHITSADSCNLDNGTDLSGDANYAVAVDIDGQTRTRFSIGVDDGPVGDALNLRSLDYVTRYPHLRM